MDLRARRRQKATEGGDVPCTTTNALRELLVPSQLSPAGEVGSRTVSRPRRVGATDAAAWEVTSGDDLAFIPAACARLSRHRRPRLHSPKADPTGHPMRRRHHATVSAAPTIEDAVEQAQVA